MILCLADSNGRSRSRTRTSSKAASTMSIPFSQEDNLVEEKVEQIKKSKVESIKQFLLNQSNKNQQQNDHHQNQEAQCNCRHHPHLSPGHVQETWHLEDGF